MRTGYFKVAVASVGLSLAVGCSTSSSMLNQRSPAGVFSAGEKVELCAPSADTKSPDALLAESRDWASQTGTADNQSVGAVNYCDAKGSRLPTARELAQVATRMGAKGILEKAVVDTKYKGHAPEGYGLVVAINADGSVDQFYYNPRGYKPPSDLNAQSSDWWSSSIQEGYSNFSYTLLGSSGILFPTNRFTKNLAMCVRTTAVACSEFNPGQSTDRASNY
jgi:hypothetical protein